MTRKIIQLVATPETNFRAQFLFALCDDGIVFYQAHNVLDNVDAKNAPWFRLQPIPQGVA